MRNLPPADVFQLADVSYEAQPLGLTTLFLLDSPASGGDTIFSDQREAYNRLSPAVQVFLEGLDAVRLSDPRFDFDLTADLNAHISRCRFTLASSRSRARRLAPTVATSVASQFSTPTQLSAAIQ